MESPMDIPTVHDLPEDFFKFYSFSRGPVLGSGMSGQVVLATSPTDPSIRLAVKMLPLLTPDGGIANVGLFTKEVMIMHRLSHPHVMTYASLARCPGYLVICTDYCHNRTLTSNLTRMTEELMAKYFLQMACAVRYLNNEMRIVHNDIKTDNIFITAKNNAILGDFGLSVEFPPGDAMISAKNLGGTLQFTAPEKSSRTLVDPYKLDMYSLGVVLWCMVTRRDPQYEHVYKWLEEDHIMSLIPQPYNTCLVSTLQADPDKRPSAVDLLNNLKDVDFHKRLIDRL